MPFKPGQSGNPKGRPKGAVGKLTVGVNQIKAEILASWGKKPTGPTLLERLKAEDPVAWFKIVTKYVPELAEERPGIDLRISVGDDRTVSTASGNGRGNGRNGNGKRGPAKGRLSLPPE